MDKEKKYQIIYADPPWQYKRKGKYAAGRYYDTMTTKEIQALSVEKLAADNSLLFLWTTNAFLHDAFHVIESWGFEYKTTVTWVKHHYGLGYWLWGQTEHLLLAAKGKHIRITPPVGTTVIHAKKQKHSKKPEEARELIEKFPYRRRLELFAREKTKGWDVWGNEVESDIDFDQL